MKILLLNTSEQTGGAAIAANRLMKALNKNSIEAKMLVRDKRSDDSNVHTVNTSWFKRKINFIRFIWERLIIFIATGFDRERLFKISIANTGADISKHPLVQDADIIHIHWINQGYLSLSDIKKLTALDKPIVWTMHDLWLCTSIYHNALDCPFFEEADSEWYLSTTKKHQKLSTLTWSRKSFIKDSSINIVTVSSWLKRQVQRSPLTNGLSCEVIPNLIDLSTFKQGDKIYARNVLSLPLDKKIITIGAARLDDPVKGPDYLSKALEHIEDKENVILVLFGQIKNDLSFLKEIQIPTRYLGPINDIEKIVLIYQATDVVIVSSLYETFGQTIIEAMACGCPAVSFNNSGQTDIINHKVNGYLAEYKDAQDLANGIEWALNHPNKETLSDACIKKVKENYTEDIVAKQYIDLYTSLLENK
jgi:Glycosyltransferase